MIIDGFTVLAFGFCAMAMFPQDPTVLFGVIEGHSCTVVMAGRYRAGTIDGHAIAIQADKPGAVVWIDGVPTAIRMTYRG
jgi:hypothetical protein